MSRYHRFKQHDGNGYMIIVQDATNPARGTVLHVNMDDDTARDHLEALRTGERAQRGVA